MKLITKAWVKFEDMDVDCFCTDKKRCDEGEDCVPCIIKIYPITEAEYAEEENSKPSVLVALDKVNREINKISKLSKKYLK